MLASPEPQEEQLRKAAAAFASEAHSAVDDMHSKWVNSHNNYVDMVDARLEIEVHCSLFFV